MSRRFRCLGAFLKGDGEPMIGDRLRWRLRSWIRAGCAIITLVAADGYPPNATAEILTVLSPEHYIRVGDLVGLTPEQAQNRLAGFQANWPRMIGFEIATPRGLLSFAPMREYLRDEDATEIEDRFRNHSEWLSNQWSECETKLERADGSGWQDEFLYFTLMFRNGRVAGVWTQRPGQRPKPYAGTLPLQDGEAFLSRWAMTPLGGDALLAVWCSKHENVLYPPVGGTWHWPGASDWMALSVLPFAIELPFLNAARVKRKREGRALYDRLTPGGTLDGGLTTFTRQYRSVKILRGRDPAYVVLRLDLGAYPSRSINDEDDYAEVGVRNGVIIWRRLGYTETDP